MTAHGHQLNRDLIVSGAVAAGLHLAAYLGASLVPSQATARTAEAPAHTPRALVLMIREAPPIETPTHAGVPPAPLASAPEPIAPAVSAIALATLAPGPIAHEASARPPVVEAVGSRAEPVPAERASIRAAVPAPPDPVAAPAPSPALPSLPPPPADAPPEPGPEPGPVAPAAPTVPPRAIDNDPPKYPRVARRRGYEGTVELRMHVLASGKVDEVEIVRSSGSSSLDRAAIRGVERWRFAPATRDGRAVDMWIEIPIEFKLVER